VEDLRAAVARLARLYEGLAERGIALVWDEHADEHEQQEARSRFGPIWPRRAAGRGSLPECPP
jgi:hypothetical protein